MSLPRIAILTMIYALIMGCSEIITPENIGEDVSLASKKEQTEIVNFLYNKAVIANQNNIDVSSKQSFCKQKNYGLTKRMALENYQLERADLPVAIKQSYLKFIDSNIFSNIDSNKVKIPSTTDSYSICSDDFASEFLDSENMLYRHHTIIVSPPIWSGDYIFIQRNKHCGSYCASGELLVLNQDSLGNWQIIESIGLWIS